MTITAPPAPTGIINGTGYTLAELLQRPVSPPLPSSLERVMTQSERASVTPPLTAFNSTI